MIENLENEIWRDIKGYEGLYQVSNLGRVKSLGRQHGFLYKQDRIMKPFKTKFNYYKINLYKNGVKKNFFIHRLVALAFIPNPNNYPVINHKDENPSNNYVDNLEWCTVKYNSNYGTAPIRKGLAVSKALKGRTLSEECRKKISEAHKGNTYNKGKYNNSKSKPIIQLDLQGDFIKEFPSARQIWRDFGFDYSRIHKACKGRVKTAYGYKWCYKENY